MKSAVSKALSVLISIVLVIGALSISPISSSAATNNQNNIVGWADYLYGITWTAKQNVTGWKYTFSQGETSHIPYSQPVNTNGYIGYGISIDEFIAATNDIGSKFYTDHSYYYRTSTYYGMDCSSFVSLCWGVGRQTTASIPNIASGKGTLSNNIDSLQLGDALNYNGSNEQHVILVTDISYSNGQVSSIEITEETPPELKRTTFSRSGLINRYGYYSIYRYEGSVPVPPNNEPVIHNPIGAVETIENSNGRVHVSGWAYDPDNTSAALQIHVYVGGEYGSSSVVSAHSNIIANKDSSNTSIGGFHRFDEYLETTARGTQSVCIYAIDATGDGPTMLGSNNIIINTLPTGRVELFSGGNAKIHIVGWAYDPDNSNDSLRLDVYVGGAYGESSVVSAHSIYADKDSDDVNNKFGISGKHRFDAWINTSADGNQPVYVYAIDSNEPIQNYMIGSESVNINHNPLGHIDSITEIPGGYYVSGWTFDPDKPGESISVHFYTGAPYGNENAEGFNAGITDMDSEDVNNQYGITGKHRFVKKIYTNKTGDQTIYMYGMKIDSFYHPITYQANIYLSPNPVAELEDFQYDNEEVYIKGWAYDKDNINYPLNIRVYCDEELISTVIADEYSEDINNNHAGKIGNNHRFESRINYNASNISYGVHKIKVVAENIANGIDYTIDERKIVICRVGDTNLDGKVTIGDVTAIQRHLAELIHFSDEQIVLADTNGDGEINISDATHLQMYLAEYDGIVLGKQTA